MEQLAMVNGGGDEGGRLQLATVGETVTRQGDGETSLRTYVPQRVKGFKSSTSTGDEP